MNLPRLRFKDEDGREFPEWEAKRLGDVASFSKGKGISKADIATDGKTLCIRYGELYTEYGETIQKIKSKTNINPGELQFSESNDVIIPASGETQIDIAKASCVLIRGVALGGDLNIIKSNENGVFLSYYLNHQKRLDIAKLAQGNSVVHLYSSQLKLLDLIIPSKPEQTKIANFLTAVDEKISQLTQKYDLLKQYKKGVMQQIFSQKLRFKDEYGREFPEWEEKLFGEIADIQRGASPRPITDKRWFSDKSNIGWVRISDVTKSSKYLNATDQYLSSEGIEKSRYVPKGHIIMSICATIGKPIYTNLDVCIHDGFVVFKNFKANHEFFYYYLQLTEDNWYQYGQPGSQVNLNTAIVSNETIFLPCAKEQTKIANFLTAIDDKITHTQTQLDAVELYKKGLLQQMFV